VERPPLGLGVRALAVLSERGILSGWTGPIGWERGVTPISFASNVAVIPQAQLLRAGSHHRAEGCARRTWQRWFRAGARVALGYWFGAATAALSLMPICEDAAGLRASRNPFGAACSVAVPCWLERAGAPCTAA
jgi:hypothetical protein